MRLPVCLVAAALMAALGSPACAQWNYEGQYPAPPEIANRMALPLCGFAAAKRWGGNGFEYCDPRNIYPPVYPRSPEPKYIRHRSYRQ